LELPENCAKLKVSHKKQQQHHIRNFAMESSLELLSRAALSAQEHEGKQLRNAMLKCGKFVTSICIFHSRTGTLEIASQEATHTIQASTTAAAAATNCHTQLCNADATTTDSI